MKATDPKAPENLRVIKTARTEDSINKAALAGFRPLLRALKPSPRIRSKFCVWQNRFTLEIRVISDFRGSLLDAEWEKVIDWTRYYPHSFPEPFAAYLIPEDIQIGEHVFVEDLIEDFIGMSWNQGDNYRLDSCAAIWDGNDLKIQYQKSKDRQVVVG